MIASIKSENQAKTWVQSLLIGDRLEYWGTNAPNWGPAQRCRGRTNEFARRMSDKRRRLGTPVIVAMLGGTGTGKSALVNALLGRTTVQSGDIRPTTHKPALICRPGLAPEEWGVDMATTQVVFCDSPVLDRLVLLDCPDPDTTEDATSPQSNLARLRKAVPYCDLLLVTGTQQKYRDHDVLDELALAAPGARLVFVQTHAGKDVDIRDDWAAVLQPHYETGKIYFVDSLEALCRQQSGEPLTGDFAELYRLLADELSEETAIKIREANYVDRAEMVIEQCRGELDQHWPGIEKLKTEVQSERQKLGEKLSEKMQQELRQDRRLWESQLISEVSSRWWFSPFSIVLRLYLLMCDVSGFLATFRRRSIMGLAMGKVAEVILQKNPESVPPDTTSPAAVQYAGTHNPLEQINGLVCWDMIELQKSALSLPGYLNQAGLPEELCDKETIIREANNAGRYFIAGLSGKVHDICGKQAKRRVTQWLRIVFEAILTVFIAAVLFQPAKSFFYDTWFASGTRNFGFEYYLIALIWGGLISVVLLAVFLQLVRRGLDMQIRNTVDELIRECVIDSLFRDVCQEIKSLEKFCDELDRIADQAKTLDAIAEQLDKRLGKRRAQSAECGARNSSRERQ
ncbi:MAG: 50S ribosome-binding GTPase [Planctomycetaceae bacterium]|nr:50S ribosome-binding GTPase [Planctomycetaceae bacterium]